MKVGLAKAALLLMALYSSQALSSPCEGDEAFVVKRPQEHLPTQKTLRAHVEFLADPAHPRGYDKHESLERTAQYIARNLEASGGEVRFQSFAVRGQEYKNVRALFGPRSKERIIVGAHYDTADGLPGADDNASGVAALLGIAQIFQRYPPSGEVELVGYTLEEPPFFRTEWMGSRKHVEVLAKERVKVKAMMSLEMLGYYTDAPDSQTFPLSIMKFFYPSTGNFIGVVGRFRDFNLSKIVCAGMASNGKVPVYRLNAPQGLTGVDFSDHLNYWNADTNAVMITDTAFYRNPNYHMPTDLPDTLDYARLRESTIQVYGAIETLARQSGQ